ncbi:MAG: hypothetical protein COY58_05385 [Gammaproteobacteria bacterium CG_4_10_14_0_8_um_filter_38_16]|nr:MAG: hypothetical protein COY58_05385 [Gammaproteobacteria bacterium CG_4_10_14_0_8_um_filter_38_16]PJA03997.1 MAG: hypothetical protein COX72_02310 [Gammaproteobacteria bacterium CG_4_10_14_0_2_um_filter_38_22]PJB09606.1 MAG: hypothetical protein CO120_09200 [Gammaproteobacteria bacterium CG_4_9_14_3_um_filter_38_9]
MARNLEKNTGNNDRKGAKAPPPENKKRPSDKLLQEIEFEECKARSHLEEAVKLANAQHKKQAIELGIFIPPKETEETNPTTTEDDTPHPTR